MPRVSAVVATTSPAGASSRRIPRLWHLRCRRRRPDRPLFRAGTRCRSGTAPGDGDSYRSRTDRDRRATHRSGGGLGTEGRLRQDEAVGDIETWTADECAAAWGVKTPTFLGYVSRGQAPPHLPERARRPAAVERRRGARSPPWPGRSRAGAGRRRRRCSARCARSPRGSRSCAPGSGSCWQPARSTAWRPRPWRRRWGSPGRRRTAGCASEPDEARAAIAVCARSRWRSPISGVTALRSTLAARDGDHRRGRAGWAERTSKRVPGTSSKRPRHRGRVCHRRRVQVTVEPEALAEWSAQARHGPRLHAGSPRSTATSRHSPAPGTGPPPTGSPPGTGSGSSGGGVARHAGPARDLVDTAGATTWPPRRPTPDLAGTGRRRRSSCTRWRPASEGPWTDRGGPRGHPDGSAGARRRDRGPRAAWRALHTGLTGSPVWRAGPTVPASPPTTTPWPRRPGRAGVAAVDARRDRGGLAATGNNLAAAEADSTTGPKRPFSAIDGEHRSGSRAASSPDRRR